MIARQPMLEHDPRERIRNFDEVALGYDAERAVLEAERCLQCENPTCMKGCPVNIDIPGFIAHIKEGNFDLAIRKIKEKNHLPAICGRVCPVKDQCEKFCVLAKKGEPVAIGNLERFASDYEWKKGVEIPRKAEASGKRVAIAGSGPAGLTAAADLVKLGHEVTIFEALHVPGGVLTYGIPEFRLPKKVVEREVEYIKRLGVDIRTDMVIGRTITADELLRQGFDAIFVGTGAGPPQFLGVPGENLGLVYSANEFLTRVNLMQAYEFPEYDTPIKVGKKVAVIGAGNVAFDAARTALRLGARDVSIVYRRSEEEIPARIEEVHHAEEEGVKLRLLTLPTRMLGEGGLVRRMECIKMSLGKPDESGRRRPIPVKGSEFYIDTDTVIVAIGRKPNPLIQQTTEGLKTTSWGTIVADDFGQTSRSGIFAGGDVVTGEATVIEAMGAGKRAAEAIDRFIKQRKKH
ncbi:MAG: dihydropyrimidine dehydrogenase [Hadesarchaea archaeon DG-33-1]|nr:MAG: dihydropyrimidine dehydrogenase [Hadesarchaea archaeon DG-33-1]